jgi:hypothetical protein
MSAKPPLVEEKQPVEERLNNAPNMSMGERAYLGCSTYITRVPGGLIYEVGDVHYRTVPALCFIPLPESKQGRATAGQEAE